MHHGSLRRAARASIAAAVAALLFGAAASVAAAAPPASHGSLPGKGNGQDGAAAPGKSGDSNSHAESAPGQIKKADPLHAGPPTASPPKSRPKTRAKNVLTGNLAATDLPTWPSLYAWQSGDGYAGWLRRTSASATGYQFAPGIPGRPGIWLWPAGRARYGAGSAGWHFTAPGTTRILSADVNLTYDPRLLSHHCVSVALRDAGLERDGKQFCRPPFPPRGTGKVEIALGDPDMNPTSTDLGIDLVLGCRAKPTKRSGKGGGRGRHTRRRPNAGSGCSKHIPLARGVANRLRVTSVDMVLVDDDLPVLVPSGEWYDLREQYVNGRHQHGLTAAATDAGSGVAHLGAEEIGAGVVAEADAPCDPHHHTDELGSRICPAAYSFGTTVDATQLAEGRHTYRETARDLAGNAAASDPWNVFVDRTPPSLASNFGALLDSGTGAARVSWDDAADPDLQDGSPGSGLAGYSVRYKREGAHWTDWQTVAPAAIDVPDSHAGETIQLEVRSVDNVGNASEAATATVVVEANLTADAGGPDVYAGDELAQRNGDYAGTGRLNLLVGATEKEGQGVSRLFVQAQDGRVIGGVDLDCSLICPDAAEHTFSVDTTPLPEGPNTIYIGALDSTGGKTLEPAVLVYIDHTAPAQPADPIVSDYDPDARTATVNWTAAGDPPLADGVPGAGRGRTKFRYRRSGGWSDWNRVDASQAVVLDLDPGERFTVEIQGTDTVGNLSPVLTAALTADDTIPESVVASASAGRKGRFARRGARRRAHAAVTFTNCAPHLDEVYEQNAPQIFEAFIPVRTVVNARLQVYCHSVDSRFDRIEIRAGLAIKTGDGHDPDDFTKVEAPGDPIVFKRPKKSLAVVYVNGPTFLCTPQWGGTRGYVGYGTIKYVDDEGKDETRDFDTGRGGIGPGPKDGTCPNYATRRARELAGWDALLAHRPGDDPYETKESTPRAELRRSLGDQPYAKAGTKNAWQAHHTVPSSQPGADDMRELLFRCRIHPNEAANGVYLRGSGLLKGKAAYIDLVKHDEDHKTALHKRAYHGDTFGRDYVSRLRSKYLGNALQLYPESCSSSARTYVLGKLSDAADALIVHLFGVEDPDH